MSLTVDQPQTAVAPPDAVPTDAVPTDAVPTDAVPAGAPEPPAAGETLLEKLGLEERPWLLVAEAVLFIVVSFAAMVVLTVLAGGDGYPR